MKANKVNLGIRSGGSQRHPRDASSAILLAFAAVVALSLGGCFGGKTVETKVVSERPVVGETGPYEIGSDDVIDVMVWKQPQLSSRLRVGSDGSITMPLIGQVHASGLTTAQLQQNLTKRFSSYVNEPQVTVRIYNPTSRVFFVLGEVTKPGMYPLMSGEVLSQALAAAGGPTEYANLRKIKIMRRESDQAVEMTVNYSAIKDGELAADVPLCRADTIVVP
jgi:polysaccharide export outer membrane protein